MPHSNENYKIENGEISLNVLFLIMLIDSFTTRVHTSRVSQAFYPQTFRGSFYKFINTRVQRLRKFYAFWFDESIWWFLLALLVTKGLLTDAVTRMVQKYSLNYITMEVSTMFELNPFNIYFLRKITQLKWKRNNWKHRKNLANCFSHLRVTHELKIVAWPPKLKNITMSPLGFLESNEKSQPW